MFSGRVTVGIAGQKIIYFCFPEKLNKHEFPVARVFTRNHMKIAVLTDLNLPSLPLRQTTKPVSQCKHTYDDFPIIQKPSLLFAISTPASLPVAAEVKYLAAVLVLVKARPLVWFGPGQRSCCQKVGSDVFCPVNGWIGRQLRASWA